MTYHIITPLRRYENLEKLINAMITHRATNDVHWHVIMDDDAPFQLFFRQPWIHVYSCPNYQTSFYNRCNSSINWLLDNYRLIPGDRYLIMNDDDGYEPGFFAKVNQVGGELIIVSMKRGHRTPAGVPGERAHATNTLVAAPENMKIGHVGVEQFIASGRILQPVRLPLHIAGDGEMVAWLCSNHTAAYAPDIYVHFNQHEPGRWDA